MISKKTLSIKKASKKIKMPSGIKPMLATLVDKPFDEEGWLYEVKWDGYRAIVYLNDGTVDMRSRNNKSFDEKFYSIHKALQQWKINAVIDGEIVVTNDKGISSFSSLQNWRSEADGDLVFYMFDILWLEGEDLTGLTLTQRKEILQKNVPSINNIRFSESFNAGATEFFEVAKKINLEGIIAKKAISNYYPGQRSKEWLKIKTGKRQEVVIGGYTNNEGSNKPFSALLVGLHENDRLIYTGKIGTGFSQKLQSEMLKLFKPLIVKRSPFSMEPDINKPSRFRPNPPHAKATWLKPELICEVSYAEMTSDGVMRHPSFEGMREDKKSNEVIMEKENKTGTVISSLSNGNKYKTKVMVPKNKGKNVNSNKLTKRLLKAAEIPERKSLLNPKDKSQTRNINGHNITFNNLNKIYFPKNRVTKRDVINFYYQVAPYMLPYMKNRPQTLIRYPNGIDGKSFYQKDVTGKVPAWVQKFPYSSERGGKRNFMVCTNEASLLLIASLGGLEMHPWSSRTSKPDNPDWCIIDLDPSDKSTFDQVIEAAQVTKEVLTSADVPCYCKTSGSTGLHIYIPLGAKYSYEQSKEFARMIVKIINSKIPDFTSIERIIENRDGKLYLDFLQNRPQATLAAPYSLRPKPNATVSMPLDWDEVTTGLKMKDFTIFNAVERIKQKGDIFTGVLGKGISLKGVLKKINKIYGEQEMHKSIMI